jgi:signal transduction histidine kinase
VRTRQIIERRSRHVILGVGGILAAIVVLLGSVALRSLGRIEEVHVHQAAALQIRAITAELERALVDQFTGLAPPDSAMLSRLRARVIDIGRPGNHLDPQTAARLERLDALLRSDRHFTSQGLVVGLSLIRGVAEAETQARLELINQIRRDARLEVELAGVLLALLLSLLIIGGWFVSRRVVGPLNDLRELFLKLGFGDFRPISREGVAPMLAPLFENYNLLVNRLQVLEAEHRSRARALQDDVQRATRALLEQHHSLANAERMAAVGETAASMAHELRNPLWGVLMSLTNMRNDISDPELAGRLGKMISEIERVVRLLKNYLDAARYEPEPLRPLKISETVEDLLGLLGYQMPQRIELNSEVPEDMESLLPRDTFRQILLNLVTNSVEAIGDSAGQVVVSAGTDNGCLTVTVTDDGPGFPDEVLSAGVRPFVSHSDSGTGLGLVMVRRAVSDLGGELEIGNRETGGAFVRFSLPDKHA